MTDRVRADERAVAEAADELVVRPQVSRDKPTVDSDGQLYGASRT